MSVKITDDAFENAARALVPFAYGAFEQHGTPEMPFIAGKPSPHCYNAVRAVLKAALAHTAEKGEAEDGHRIAPADVFKLLKHAHDSGYLDYDHLPKLSRDIANLKTGSCPIPGNVYYSSEHDNFYSLDAHKGQGHVFYRQWSHRCSEFPGDPRLPVSAPPAPRDDLVAEVERLRAALEEAANMLGRLNAPRTAQLCRAALEGHTDAA